MKRFSPLAISTLAVLVSYLPIFAASIDFSTYLGGTGGDKVTDIALGPNGSVYVVGVTWSADLPTLNAYDSSYNGGSDLFIARFSDQGQLLACTYLGGSADDFGDGVFSEATIVVDATGCVFVTSITESSDFPTVNAFDPTYNGQEDAFIAKLSPGCDSLLFSTYIGGANREDYSFVGIDNEGNTYFAGSTFSPDFPLLNPADSIFQSKELWMLKIPAGGTSPVWSTFLGGNSGETLSAMTVDSIGNIYLTGYSGSRDLPYLTPVDNRTIINFVAKVSYDGNLAAINSFGSYMGDFPFSIAVDGTGNVYVTGQVMYCYMPLANPYDGLCSTLDAFVWKISPGLDSLLFSTYLGGNQTDCALAVITDPPGNAYVVGYSHSQPNFPIINPVDSLCQDFEAFITIFPAGEGCPILSSYLGGLDTDEGYAVALGESNKVYIAGYTNSPDFPGPYVNDPSYNGNSDGFLTKLDLSGLSVIPGSITGTMRNHVQGLLGGVRAVLEGCVAEAYSDSTGVIVLEDVCPGYYQIEFSHPDYYDTTVTDILVGQGEPVLFPELIFETPKGSMMGTVTDSRGTPLQGVDVVVSWSSPTWFGTTDDQGRYLIRGIVPSICNVTFNAPFHYDTSFSGIQVSAGETTYVNASMIPYRQEVSAWFGNPDGSPVVAPVGGMVGIDLWMQTADTVEIAFLSAPLAAMDSYVTSLHGETEGRVYYPLTGWDDVEFNPTFGAPPNDSGWSSQELIAFYYIYDPPGQLLNFAIPTKIATYVVRVSADPDLVGDTVSCLGQGPQPYWPYPGIVAGAIDGFTAWSAYEHYSPLAFVEGGASYISGDVNGNGIANGIDVSYSVTYFKGGPPPPMEVYCPPHGPLYAAGDVNGNCTFNGIDVSFFVNYLKGINPSLLFCLDCPPGMVPPSPAMKPILAPTLNRGTGTGN